MKISNIQKPIAGQAKHRLLSLAAGLLYTLTAGHPVLADDTEVLVGPGGQAWAAPNVLFVMDTSGSMGTDIAGNNPSAGNPSRLSIVQNVFAELMDNSNYWGINAALMRFDSSAEGGYFVTPMQELNSSTKDSIITASNNLTAGGSTPLSETFYEAALFWGGKAVDYGDSSSPGTNVNGVATGGNYISPITSECQKNFTILLTDGVPTSDSGANNKVATMTGANCSGNCLDEIAKYLYTTDQNSTIPNGYDIQKVETYTIGFTTDQALLEAAALEGGGTATAGGGNDHYINANSETQLSMAFTDALGPIADTNDGFSPPALAANAFNGISHFNKLYFALFEPAPEPKWGGNVKPYAIDDNFNLVDAQVPPQPVVNAGGFFRDDSQSFWSLTNDGANITDGGANGQLPSAANRNLYTYTGDYVSVGSYTLSDPSNALISGGSSALTPALLGLTTPAQVATFDTVLDTMRSASLGAPLHSQPALVTYGGTEASPDLTLFVATNDGFLHALNAQTGVEEFAFVPQELLPNLPKLANGLGPMVYGLDGNITTWVKESNDPDYDIESTEGDHVFVYVGMRRGGNNYYALDVTDRDAPVLKWVIQGGTTGFEELGQSWSTPKLTTINYGSGTRKVLIFAGGYDTAQDANPLNNVVGNEDTTGRAIYIVDADTGALLWSAGPSSNTTANPDLPVPELTHSIPSDVSLLDSDLDGHTDRLYVGDMRGQVFRFDLRANTSGGGMTGSYIVLASLSGNTEADNRRFYYPPDLVVTQNNGAAPYISVNIGSGYRAHPLSRLQPNGTPAPLVSDRFYSLRDPLVIGVAPSGTPVITDSNLLDITGLPVLDDNETASLNAGSGWYLELGNDGEKVLAPAVTINGEILFTTYTPPEAVAVSNCAPPPGVGRLYRVSLFDASPVVDYNEDSDIEDEEDRSNQLKRPGIPPGSATMFREDSNGNVDIVHCEGTECNALPNAIQMQRTYWQNGL